MIFALKLTVPEGGRSAIIQATATVLLPKREKSCTLVITSYVKEDRP